MTSSLERRLAAMEQKLEAGRRVPFWKDKAVQDTVQRLLAAPVTPNTDPKAWDDRAVTRSRAKQRIESVVGRPVWLDGSWRWPAQQDKPVDGARVWMLPG